MDRAVSRALSILEAVTRSRTPVRLSTLALDLELQKSTVHRILQTLAAMGYVTQEDETGRYAPTLKTWEMGSAVISEHPVKRAAASFLNELNRTTGETVSLTVMSGDDVLYLDKIVSPRPIQFTTRPGSRIPAPLAAGGQAMLALEPESEARAIVDRVAARLLNKRDFDADAFMVELEAIQARGYAISSANAGVVSVAAAILGHGGRAAAAISVSAPKSRLTDAKQDKIVEAVLGACARLAETIGEL